MTPYKKLVNTLSEIVADFLLLVSRYVSTDEVILIIN